MRMRIALEYARVRSDYEVGHQVDDVAACEVFASFIGFGEATHQVLEDGSHLGFGDLLGAEIALVRVEVLHHLVQHAVVGEVFHLILELHAVGKQDVLHVVGEAVDVLVKIALDVVGIGDERFLGMAAGVVEGIT